MIPPPNNNKKTTWTAVWEPHIRYPTLPPGPDIAPWQNKFACYIFVGIIVIIIFRSFRNPESFIVSTIFPWRRKQFLKDTAEIQKILNSLFYHRDVTGPELAAAYRAANRVSKSWNLEKLQCLSEQILMIKKLAPDVACVSEYKCPPWKLVSPPGPTAWFVGHSKYNPCYYGGTGSTAWMIPHLNK